MNVTQDQWETCDFPQKWLHTTWKTVESMKCH